MPHTYGAKFSGAEPSCDPAASGRASVEQIRVLSLAYELIGKGLLYDHVGERTNVTGPRVFAYMILTSIP